MATRQSLSALPATLTGLTGVIVVAIAHPGKGQGATHLTIAAALTLCSLAFALISLPGPHARRTLSVTAFVSATMGAVMTFGLIRAERESVNALKCPWHLSQIGLALYMYSKSHDGKLPPSLETLVTTSLLSPESLVCDLGPDTPAHGDGPALAADLARPGHDSYIYLGANKSSNDFGPDDIVAYDRPENHDNVGANIVTGDGHTEWLPLASLQDALTHRNPTSTQPTSRPQQPIK
jgi:hypothetical protein